MSTVQYNPFDLRFRSNPYPLYAEMRQHEPVQWNAFLQLWVLTRYEHVEWLLNDPRFSADRRTAANPFVQAMVARQEEFGALGRAPTMLGLDPPAHTRLRRLVSKAFTPRRVEELKPRIVDIVQDLLSQAGQTFDIVRDLAWPLPVIVIAEMLGVPSADRDSFKRWSDDVAAALGAPFTPPDVLEQSKVSVAEMSDYFRQIIRERRGAPQDDLISALLAAEEQRQSLTEEEMLSTCMLLLVAGNETTTNLIGNGVLALLRHPEQMQRLRGQPELIGPAVEEMLRYDSPVQATSRVAAQDIDLDGHQLKAGQVVIGIIGSANRDSAVFPEAAALDIARQPNRHLAFGDGIHFCLGAALARAEAQIAIGQLLVDRRGLSLIEEPEWTNSFVLRGPRSLFIEAKQ
ncbi:MAG TPA: cytochrome P450 [Dehalococcoidia bacterium]|nr:cytochrome P450 [Dehalococcoidia bacterium]